MIIHLKHLKTFSLKKDSYPSQLISQAFNEALSKGTSFDQKLSLIEQEIKNY